jgi:hypothetical protein
LLQHHQNFIGLCAAQQQQGLRRFLKSIACAENEALKADFFSLEDLVLRRKPSASLPLAMRAGGLLCSSSAAETGANAAKKVPQQHFFATQLPDFFAIFSASLPAH